MSRHKRCIFWAIIKNDEANGGCWWGSYIGHCTASIIYVAVATGWLPPESSIHVFNYRLLLYCQSLMIYLMLLVVRVVLAIAAKPKKVCLYFKQFCSPLSFGVFALMVYWHRIRERKVDTWTKGKKRMKLSSLILEEWKKNKVKLRKRRFRMYSYVSDNLRERKMIDLGWLKCDVYFVLFCGCRGDSRVDLRVIFVKVCEEFDWCD